MLRWQLTDRGQILNSLHTYMLLTDNIDKNMCIFISVVRMIFAILHIQTFMRAFPRTFCTAVACNFKQR
jgi:fumarate reductase subunit C